MKRLLIPLLILILLAGCKKPEPKAADPVQPINFYYRTANTGFTDENGLIRAEQRDLGTKTYTDRELFSLYLAGPQSSALVSPISSGTQLLSVDRGGGILTIRLSENYTSRSGIDHSILDACLVKTGMQLEGIRKVRIRVESRGGQLLRDNIFTDGDILLYDSGETPEVTKLTLYFSDAGHNQLLEEVRTIPFMESQQLPEYVVRQLLAGPQSQGMISVLPQGTALLDINVDGGVCSVDFNADFYTNRPETQQGEQLALLSVVNSLCELDGINQVQFYVEGRRCELYSFLSLAEPFGMDPTVVGPIREELNEFEGVVCLPGSTGASLHSLRVRVRLRGNQSKEEALLLALFERASQNGLRNPTEHLPAPVAVTVSGFSCTVDFAAGSLDGLGDQEQAEVLRCITATLTSSSTPRRVSFRVDGVLLNEEPMGPADWWFCE